MKGQSQVRGRKAAHGVQKHRFDFESQSKVVIMLHLINSVKTVIAKKLIE